MTPHLSQEQFALYRSRSLAAAQLLQASQHLVECEMCRAWIASPAEWSAEVEAVRAILDAEGEDAAHLTYDEIAAYVDKQLSAAEAAQIDTHVRECRTCADELAQIEALRREVESPQKSAGWLERMISAWQETFTWRGALALAGAAACASLVFFVVRTPAPQAGPRQANAQQQPPAKPPDAFTGLDNLPGALRASIQQAITAQRIETPAVLADLSGKRGVLLGPSTAPPKTELVAPVGIVVETQRPALRWKPISGAEYQVSIYSEGFEEVATSGWIRTSEWQVAKPLGRGARYSWQITVRQNGAAFTVPTPPAPEARFRILDAAGEAEIAQLKTASANSHMLLGVGYAQLGALDDAERELRQAGEQNPQSAIIPSLLASVEQMRTSKPR